MEKKALAPKRKRKIKKGKGKGKITKQTIIGKGGNVSQVVNVYVSKANRRRATAPTKPTKQFAPSIQFAPAIQFTPAIQPQMYNAGQDSMISGLKQQNQTLLSILDKQRKADTTPNSDIKTLDDLVNKKKIKIDEKIKVVGLEDLDDFKDLSPRGSANTSPSNPPRGSVDASPETALSQASISGLEGFITPPTRAGKFFQFAVWRPPPRSVPAGRCARDNRRGCRGGCERARAVQFG